jgi:hypothetical protein
MDDLDMFVYRKYVIYPLCFKVLLGILYLSPRRKGISPMGNEEKETDMLDTPVKEEWKMMKDAAVELGLKPNKLSRLAASGRIKSRHNPRDERQRLVDMVELRKLFPDDV